MSKTPYPFPDNSFDVIYISHVLEHLPDNIAVMEELYRIVMPGGRVIVRVPHFSHHSAWGDPTHLRAYSSYQFRYYSHKHRDHYGDCDFEILREELHYTRLKRGKAVSSVISPVLNFLANLNVRLCERLWCHWVGGFAELYIELAAVKG